MSWMQNLLHGLVPLELIRQGEAVSIELWHSLRNIPTGLLKGYGIGIAELCSWVQGLHQLITPG